MNPPTKNTHPIKVTRPSGEALELEAREGITLAQALVLHGIWKNVPLCSGLGKCAGCRVRFLSTPPAPTKTESRRLSEEDREQGVRLACLHRVEPGVRLEVDEPSPLAGTREGSDRLEEGYRLAVDLGTTTVHWAAEDHGRSRAFGGGLNPQMGLGSEVMSRLSAALFAGLGPQMQSQAADRIGEIVDGLGPVPGSLAVSGNPAMIYLLFGMDPSRLARAPYALEWTGGEERAISSDLPPAYVPPLLGPFVGADVSAGLAWLIREGNPTYPFLFADMGTNGEFVLALSEDEFLLASVPLGPALEGVGLRHGGPAAPGVAVGFEMEGPILKAVHLDRKPGIEETERISGTGYLSLLALLLGQGVLDEQGSFGVPETPLGKRLARFAETGGERAVQVTENLVLTPSDVEEVLKVKAAFNLGFSTLLEAGNLSPGDLGEVVLGGALGEHLQPAILERLGFLPQGLGGRTRAAGNTSLAGTMLTLADAEARKWLDGLPGRCRLVELAGRDDFQRLYLERMVFAHV